MEEVSIERQWQVEIDEAIMAHSEKWARPGTDLEAALYAEIAAMPHEVALAAPGEALVGAGMRFADCHSNCTLWTQRDRSSKYVAGWWQMGDAYVLHSVIDVSGELFCVTPQYQQLEAGSIVFVRDTKLQWVDVDGILSFQRDGRTVLGGVRKYPERFKLARDLLLKGMGKGLCPRDAWAAAVGELGNL